MRPCPPKHTVYLSQMVADNAVTLHRFQNPACETMMAFSCGDHFHIGHASKAGKEACLATGGTAPPRWTRPDSHPDP